MQTAMEVIEDRRGGDRQTQNMPAQILCPDGTILDCVILDLSGTGAKIAFAVFADVPEKFSVKFEDGQITAAEGVWQNGDLMGVRFANHGSTMRSAGEIKARIFDQILAIEDQIVKLRQEVNVHFRE